MADIKCPRRHCETPMFQGFDPIGRVTYTCRQCARNQRGLCRDCPRRLSDPRAFRCEPCRVIASRRRTKRYKQRLRQDPPRWAKSCRRRRQWNKTPKGRASIRAANDRHRMKKPRVFTAAERQYQREWARQNRLNDIYRRKRNKRDRARRRRDAEWAEARRAACRLSGRRRTANRAATQKRRPTTSRYVGVALNKQTGHWRAQIRKHGRVHHLGTYHDELEAALAYGAAYTSLSGSPSLDVQPDTSVISIDSHRPSKDSRKTA